MLRVCVCVQIRALCIQTEAQDDKGKKQNKTKHVAIFNFFWFI